MISLTHSAERWCRVWITSLSAAGSGSYVPSSTSTRRQPRITLDEREDPSASPHEAPTADLQEPQDLTGQGRKWQARRSHPAASRRRRPRDTRRQERRPSLPGDPPFLWRHRDKEMRCQRRRSAVASGSSRSAVDPGSKARSIVTPCAVRGGFMAWRRYSATVIACVSSDRDHVGDGWDTDEVGRVPGQQDGTELRCDRGEHQVDAPGPGIPC